MLTGTVTGILAGVTPGMLLAVGLGEIGDLGDGFIVIVRWLHGLGAVAWVGGSAFFALVVRPAQRVDPEGVGQVIQRFTGAYRDLVDASIITIVVTGLIMMFERLTGDDASVVYFIVLSVKIVIAGWMFYVVRRLPRVGCVQDAGAGVTQRLSWLLR